MTIDQAIAYLEGQGFQVKKSGGGYLVTNTQAKPPKQYSYDSPGGLIADAEDLREEAIRQSVGWDEAWGPFPMKGLLGDEPAYEIAFAIAKWKASQFDLGAALRDAIAEANEDAIEAAQSGDSGAAQRASQRLGDLRAQYAQWRQSIQPTKEPPSGAFATQAEAQAEAQRLGAGYEAVRDPRTGQWFVQTTEEEELVERFLGTVSEGGWSIDQYGYTDANGRQIITRRQPRRPIKDPIQSIDDMIALALRDVDFHDPNWKQDTDYLRAQSLRAFQKQPTAQERLQMALQIAQSPSDYLTLVALYVGAIERETPAKVGERIAPLAPFLQELARQFFLDIQDIPGITKVREEPEEVLERRIPGEELEDEGVIPVGGGEGDGKGEGRKPEDVLRERIPIEELEDEGVIPPDGEVDIKTRMEALGKAAGIVNPTGTLTPAEVAAILAGTYTGPGSDLGVPSTTPPPTTTTPSGEQRYDEMGEPDPNGEYNANGQYIGPPPTLPSMGGETLPSMGEAGEERGEEGLFPSMVKPTEEETVSVPSRSRRLPSIEDTGGGPKVSMEELDAYIELTKKRLVESKKKQKIIPSFQRGGTVPGIPGFSTLIAAEPGETVLTREQIQALLRQSGMFGPVYRPGLQELPSFLTRPKTVSIASLTGGALRPRSLQTQRRMSPTQRALYQPLVESFGVPYQDWQQEEQMATGLGPRRSGVRWRLPSMARLR